MRVRWLLNLVLALLVTGALATGIAAAIQALAASAPPPWLEPWLPAATLVSLLLGPIVMTINAYRRRRAKDLSAKQD
jgi:hypothetical protein